MRRIAVLLPFLFVAACTNDVTSPAPGNPSADRCPPGWEKQDICSSQPPDTASSDSSSTPSDTASADSTSADRTSTDTASALTVGSGQGIWIGGTEIAALPTSGAAWDAVKKAADSDLSGGSITKRDDHNTRTMAAALVAARLNSNVYRAKVRDALVGLINAPINLDDRLAAERKMGAYVIAADLIALRKFDSSADARFRTWIVYVRDLNFNGGGGAGSFIDTNERRANNHGLQAGFSRATIAAYVGDRTELARTAQVFRGWLGDRSAYTGFKYGSLSWQCDPDHPVGINPRGCTKDAHSIDGVLPDDQRRCGSFRWPPCLTNYAWGGLGAAVAEAWVLRRQGYDVFNWGDQALKRAASWLYTQADYSPQGDDTWAPYVLNHVYATSFAAPYPARSGKNVGWTDWTLR